MHLLVSTRLTLHTGQKKWPKLVVEWGVCSFPSGGFQNTYAQLYCWRGRTCVRRGCWMCHRGRISLDPTCPKTPSEPVFFGTTAVGPVENCSNIDCFLLWVFGVCGVCLFLCSFFLKNCWKSRSLKQTLFLQCLMLVSVKLFNRKGKSRH